LALKKQKSFTALNNFFNKRKDRAMTNNNLLTADRTEQAIEMIEQQIIKAEQDFESQKKRIHDEVTGGYDLSFAVGGYYEAREIFDAFKTVLRQIKDDGLDKTIRQISYDLQNGCWLPINDGVKRIEEYWRFRAYSDVLNYLMMFKDRHRY
jgi:hypothetical protein